MGSFEILVHISLYEKDWLCFLLIIIKANVIFVSMCTHPTYYIPL